MNFKRVLVLVMALVMMVSACAPSILVAAKSETKHEHLSILDNPEYAAAYEEIKATVEYVANDIAENHEEYYAAGYAYALENGYLDAAVEAIKLALDAIENVDLSGVGMTDELREKLETELDALVPTLEKIVAILESGEASDFDGFVNALLTLEGDLYTHLNNIYAICEQAGIDLNQIVLVPAFNEALRILNEQVIPALNAAVEAFVDAVVDYVVDALAPYYEKVVEVLDIARDTYDNIVETLVKLNIYVEGVVDEAVEAFNALVATLLEIYGTVENVLEAVENAINTAVEIYNGIVDAIVELNAKVENTILVVENTIVAVVNAYKYTVELLVNVYDSVQAAIVVAGQIFDHVVEFVVVNKPLVEAGIANGVELAKEIYAEVLDILEAAYAEKDDVMYVAAQISAYIAGILNEIDGAVNDTVNGALNGNYELTDDSAYVAIGNAPYADSLAAKLNLSKKYDKFDIAGNYAEKVASADLVTVKLDNGEFMALAEAQVMGTFAALVRSNADLMAWYNAPFVGDVIKETVAGLGIDINAKTVELDWSKYLDAEGMAELDEALALIKADLIENNVPEFYEFDFNPIIEQAFVANGMGGIFTWTFAPVVVPVADLMVFAIENVLYSYAEFTGNLVNVLNDVYTLAPEATVVLTGVNNPLVGFEFMGFDLSDYADSVDLVVDCLNVHLFACALANENTIFVNSEDAEDIYAALNVHCQHVYDDCVDAKCDRCLEVRVAPGHSFTKYVSNNDATCLKDGTETAKCDHCDEENTRTLKNSKTGHEMGEWKIVKEPTSSENGLEQRKCLHCDHTDSRELGNKGLSALAIAGIVIACVAVVGGASAGLAAWLKKKNRV